MYHLFAVALVLFCLPLVFGLPFFLQRPGVQRALQRIRRRVPASPRRAAFYPLDMSAHQEPSPEEIRRQCMVRGAVLCTAVLLALLLVSMPSEGSRMYVTVRNTLVFGLVLGGGSLVLQRRVRDAQVTTRCGKLLDGMGLTGLWLGDEEESHTLIFGRSLLDEIHRSRSLDAIGCSGLTFLRALSKPDAPSLSAPHPALIGARVRLLLVPPRGQKVDPDRQRSTCAEGALARLERRPEQHWRDLHHALEVQQRWINDHGVDIDVRFIEDRPPSHVLLAGPRAWFRPWASGNDAWLEVMHDGRHPRLHGIMQDVFANAWGNATGELSVPLSSAGPTGSFFVREGVEVREGQPQVEVTA